MCIIVKCLEVIGKEIAKPIPSENFEIQHLRSLDSGIRQKKAEKGQRPRIQDSLGQLFRVKGKIKENRYSSSHYREMHLHWHAWCTTLYLVLENHLHEHQWGIEFALAQNIYEYWKRIKEDHLSEEWELKAFFKHP